MFPKLKVFSGKAFADSEGDFNAWMQAVRPTMIMNIAFNNGESLREITVLYTDQVADESRVKIPALSFPQRNN